MYGSGKMRQWLKSWPGPWREWTRVILLFLALEIAVLSVEWAHWITPQPSLTLVLFISVLAAWRLARGRFPGWLSHLTALFIGAAVTLWQGSHLLPASPGVSRLGGLVLALQSWWQAGGPAQGNVTISFGVFLIVVTGLVGHISTWFLVRRGNPWPGVALGGVVVLVNLSNLPDSYYLFFGVYFLAGALLVAWNRLAVRSYFVGNMGRYARRGLAYAGASLLCLVVLAGTLAWAVPEPRLTGLRTAVATRTLWTRDIEGSHLNVFASVPSKQPINTAANLDELNFGPLWHESDKIDFVVDAARPAYWRVHVYDTYNATGWSNSPVSDYMLDKAAAWGDGGASEDPVSYNVTAEIKTDVLLMSGDFIAADTPVLVHVGGDEVVGVTIPRVLGPGERYSVTSGFVSPSPEELAGVRADYPPDIAAVYLQLPPDFPGDVSQLARRLTRRARTPYQKVQAIDDYLSGLTYSKQVDGPPEGSDGVEYFLFTQKSGFCIYFASAMAVMLRSVDVPARLAVGYLPGEPGSRPGEYILRDKHYHAWVQAYFPGYGWVDLEATPGGSGAPDNQVAVETPWVSTDTIEQLPIWDPWQILPYDPLAASPPSDPGVPPPEPNPVVRGPLPFAAALGRVLLLIVAGIILVAVALTPFLALRRSFLRWLWHVDRGDLAAAAYAKMAALAGMVNLGPKPQQTPLEFSAELGAVFPQEARDVDRIASIYAASRFSGRQGKLGLFEEAEVLKARCRIYVRLLGRLGIMRTVFGRRRTLRGNRE